MKELIPISKHNGKKAVSARNLYKFLAPTERFSAWFERQLQYGFTERIDYVGCKVFNTLANQELTDYALTIDCAKEISMLQKTERGKQARQYFIACEKKLKEQAKPLTQLEIAELTHKQHKDVSESIRNMEPAWVKVNGRKFPLVEYTDAKGENYQCTKPGLPGLFQL